MDLESLAARLRRHVEAVAAAPRPAESPGHAAAAAYVRDQLTAAGFDVWEAPFREAGLIGVNLLTRPWPDDPALPLLLVAAHYDGDEHTPGADDNASGVAGLIEIGAALGQRLRGAVPTAARLQLAAYDLEEAGLVGSFVHSRQLRQAGRELRGMIALEMIGFTAPTQRLPPALIGVYPSVGDFIGVVGNDASADLVQGVKAGLTGVPGLPVQALVVPGNGRILPEVRLSDHSPFWDQGFPAVMVSDTSFFRNPHYHQATDTPDTLDYQFLARVTAGLIRAVTGLLGLP
jgi:Zn-dependent M28 family amino/carboxypeptidase